MLWHLAAAALAGAAVGAPLAFWARDLQADAAAAEIQATTATAREEAMHAGLVRLAGQLKTQQEATRYAAAQTRAAEADLADASGAADRMQLYAEGLARAARCDPAAASDGQATPGPAELLADMRRRLEAAGREHAAESDRRGIAGAACQQSYDALRPGG
jgi:hypothetical protein